MNGIMVRSLPEGREKTFAQHEVKSGYTSEARDQGMTGGVKPKLYGEVRASRAGLACAHGPALRILRPTNTPRARRPRPHVRTSLAHCVPCMRLCCRA